MEDSFAGSEGDLDVHDFGLAFNLTNTVVPEPASLVLVFVGGAAISLRRRLLVR